MLDRQINLYSVDTGHFYSNHEKYLHDKIIQYKKETDHIKKLRAKNMPLSVQAAECEKWDRLIRYKQAKSRETKEKLLSLLSNKAKQNERTGGKDHIRHLRENDIRDHHVISVFESALTRAIGIQEDELTDSLLVVQVYYFDIFKDLSFYGFIFRDQKYKYLTSSAGQIRSKKALFIRESVWLEIEQTILCGLTVNKINARGGNNANKYLAYMALANSATDEWKEFDIDKCIVIDDFETKVYGTFDLIDETDYSIIRKTDYIPVTHTDGAGMMLPSVMKKNTMFRAPWIKGLLGVFDFRKFIETSGCSPVITDIYGKAHDVIAEDIEIIFCRSQFKMWKYYDSWEDYKNYFKSCGCQAGLCNTEEERIKKARINYQMLQTLTDITDEEIDLLCARSAKKVMGICTSEETMKEVLGITPYNTNMTPFQRAVKLYPALLNDTYTKDILRDIKNSLLKKYRSGKLEINGRYTFLLPDFYAACEHWFLHTETPEGLLADQEVFCRFYRKYEKLDCLRSPHLYREHAVRLNTANASCGERSSEISEWFVTDGIYTSSHDLISKLLMFDVDGDKSLVVADPDFVRIAERNMKDIVPLYYNMKKAKPTELNTRTIYEGLNAAFVGGNIGTYSNNISKIWNSSVFIEGTDREKQHAIDCVKRLCCQNNFVIDYAKTLYKPEFPKEIREEIKKFTGQKLPAFFRYAKDKEGGQTAARNGSFVNKIFERIPDVPLNTKGLKLDDIEYKKMMRNPETICPPEVGKLYDSLNRKYRYMVNRKDEYIDNLHYVANKIRLQFTALGYTDSAAADMLTEYLYSGRTGKKRYKQLLWFCYGQYIVSNLENNVTVHRTKYIQCADCGEWVEVDARNMKKQRCSRCQKEYRKAWDRERKAKKR